MLLLICVVVIIFSHQINKVNINIINVAASDLLDLSGVCPWKRHFYTHIHLLVNFNEQH